MAKRVLNHDEEPNNRVSSKKKFTATKFLTRKLRDFWENIFYLEIFETEQIGHFRNSKSNIRLWLWNSW